MHDLLADIAWEFDVIAVSETWNDVNNQINFSPPLLNGYHPYTGSTGSSQNGGCGFYISESLSPTPRKDLEFKIEEKGAESECHWLELTSNTTSNTVIGVIYRHPSGKVDKFLAELENILKKLEKENKKTIKCGDFNLRIRIRIRIR
jgi:exonuclease III